VDLRQHPADLELLATGTSQDVDRASCLWRAPSVGPLPTTRDPLTGQFAVNDCGGVSDEFASVAGHSTQAVSA
jgi:hypothetical protein